MEHHPSLVGGAVSHRTMRVKGFEVDAVVGDVECIHVLDFLRMLWANQIEPQTVKDGEGQADWKDLPHHRHPST